MNIFWTHFALTWALIGAVWFVQIVHYPAFRYIPKDSFKSYESFNLRRTSYLAIPFMAFEALTAALLLSLNPSSGLFLANTILIAIIWALTFLICLPNHKSLKITGFTSKTFNRLLSTHFTRTLLWSFRGFLLLTYLEQSSR